MAQLLTSELTALGAEARRKHPDIKQATDSALTRLRSDTDVFLASLRNDESPPLDHPLLKPILLSCETKLPKLISLAMALLQRILLQRLVPDSGVPIIVKTLNKLLTPPTRSDVDVQLKILQIASALLSSYPNLHNADLSNTLMLGFKLHEGSKVAVVSSTAAATLRQSVMAVFDKVKDEDAVLDGIKGGGEDAAALAPVAAMSLDLPQGAVTLFPSSRDAYLVFSDLCSLANAEPATFLSLDSLSKTFSLELVESVLSNHQRLFASAGSANRQSISHPELLYLLRSKVCPLLIKSLSEPPAFPIHLRLMRLLFLLLRQFSSDLVLEVEILLSILLRTINPSAQELAAHGGSPSLLWQQVLALEVLRSLCSDDVFLRNLWLWYDSGSTDTSASEPTKATIPVFSKLVETLQNVLVQGEIMFAQEPSMHNTTDDSQVPHSPRKSRVRPSTDRSFSGLYEAAAGVASAAMSGMIGSSANTGTETLSSTSSPAIQIIDQLDKTEAPVVASPALPKTYPQLLALQSCHLLTQSMALYALPLYSRFVNARNKQSAPAPPAMQDADIAALTNPAERDGLRLTKAMLRSSALPLSQVLAQHLRIKCNDSIFEETLLALRNLTNVTGALDLVQERDVVITRFITLAVPGWDAGAPSVMLHSTSDTTLSTRNLACLKAYVQVAYYLSGALGPFWHPVLSGLCTAQASLVSLSTSTGSKDETGKDEDADTSRNGRATLSTLTHASMVSLDTRSGRSQLQLLNVADLQPSRLQAHIQNVFENTASLDDSAFVHFISSLCRLSGEMLLAAQMIPRSAAASNSGPASPRASEIKGRPSSSRDEAATAFYPISCLDLVASLNTTRLCRLPADQGWQAVTTNLIEALSSPRLPPNWRAQASQALNKIAFGTMSEAAENPDHHEKLRLQKQALQILSNAGILDGRRAAPVDVELRTSSVEHLNKILETFGHSLGCGWETIFDICSATCKEDKRNADTVLGSSASVQKVQLTLVKAGFSCLQLVCSDFLSALDAEQIGRCCGCLNDFGSQDLDVNVALTANGCLWGVTAEMAARAKTKSTDPNAAYVDTETQPLWLLLLQCLLSISQSPRAEVRNGAISNLFRVLQHYGDMLTPAAWQEIVDTIIFPLIKVLSASIKDLESGGGGEGGKAEEDRKAQLMGILPSELKQWQESESLAFTQFGEVVRAYLPTKLIHSSAFEETWSRLLDLTTATFLSGPADLSQAAMKCFTFSVSTNVDSEVLPDEPARARAQMAWRTAWKSWIAIGEHVRRATSRRPETRELKADKCTEGEAVNTFRFTQANLLAYIQAFPPIHRVLQADFDQANVEALLTSLKACVSYPHSPDNMSDRASLTNVQVAARATARSVANVKGVPALILSDLSECICLAFSNTELDASKDKKAPTFIALSRASIEEAYSVFVKHEDDISIYEGGAFESLLAALIVPIKLKYECQDSPVASCNSERKADARPVWQLATLTLCRILSLCCPKLQKRTEDGRLSLETVEILWTKIIDAIQAAVLADSSLASTLPKHVKDADELFGLFVLSSIEKHVLPYLGGSEVPDHLIERVGHTLVLGSTLYTFETQTSSYSESGRVDDPSETTNERFAYWCFDLLFLGCSGHFGKGSRSASQDTDARRRVAVILLRHLTSRCEETLVSFARDLEIRGMVPMQRIRQEELNYVLNRYVELRLYPATYTGSATKQLVPRSSQGWHASERAHLFAAYRHFLLLVSSAKSTAGTSTSTASIGTSLPPIVPADSAEMSKTFSDLGLELGIIGVTRDVLAASERDARYDASVKEANAGELALKAMALVGDELEIPLLRM